MKGDPEQRAIQLGEYIAAHRTTVRAAAAVFGCSKSTVHKDVAVRLRTLQPELFRKAKKNGVHTTLDTSGNPFTREEPYFSKFNELMKYTDLLLLDIKLIDDKAHRELTGCTNENILDLARYLDEIGKPVWIRHVLVPERSDYDEYLIRLDEFLHSLHNVQRVEVLPYHTLGVFKWETLGIPYKLEGINPPTKERVENANKLLHTAEYTGYLK